MCMFCVKKWNKIHYHRGVDAILVYLSDSLPLIENKARVQKISHYYDDYEEQNCRTLEYNISSGVEKRYV